MNFEKNKIRLPAVAGAFYPGTKKDLSHIVSELLQEARERRIFDKPKKIIGLVAPHAGYVYSGFTAATAYSYLSEKEFESVVIVSPSHHEYFDGISVFPGNFYETPLGRIPLDQDLRDKLLRADKKRIVGSSDQGHGPEHALEVQLPFLQETLHDFKLLPLVIGNQSPEICEALGNLLGKILQNQSKTLLVASSDLSHFHDAGKANKLDKVCLDVVSGFDTKKLLGGLRAQKFEACGAGPIAAVMLASQKLGAGKAHVIHHCNSGDVTGDGSSVVGYMSAMFYEQ